MGAVELILIRHGESMGNVAATEADRARADRVRVPARDPDVVLSPVGEEQAAALGRHLGTWDADELPQSLWVSPYRRARQTADGVLAASGLDLSARVDERLRDRELGILDALTGRGVRARHPEEAERRTWLGKFYYRPPGGESWADVALRLRSVLADIDRDEDGKRVLVVCHDAVITLIRYVCERIEVETLMEDARRNPVPNGSVTRLIRPSGEGTWTSIARGDVEHLREQDAPVTEHRGERRGR
ncbi:histidine phosphatase family protein [Naasia aerilata]|uniref:Phosphoglycerate mutase n=1 Tax=Naasia aerilata TaxID=1162966 RepID=A0ABM8GFG5_9MICO|nr:histidine phosphatase family protein [Naasia aerilata]BDZ47076.1 phosphoglycerate mutase [Naasia aerilata]